MKNNIEYLQSIKRINDAEIKNIVSIEEINLKSKNYFLGSKIPKHWQEYFVLYITYNPIKFNGGYSESFLAFFTNEFEKNNLLHLLKK